MNPQITQMDADKGCKRSEPVVVVRAGCLLDIGVGFPPASFGRLQYKNLVFLICGNLRHLRM